MTQREVIQAELTWLGDRFVRDVQVMLNEGLIEAVGSLGLEPTRQLDRQALLPGMISAHSHAFQRALRGRGESFPEGSGSFWSWRQAMYQLVEQLDHRRFYETVRGTFDQMLAAGITTVGEFHYLHHSPAASDYAFDQIVLQAARDAGIRIVLLMTYYRTGGIGQPLAPPQTRFETASLDEFWRQVDALDQVRDSRTQTIGVAAHSIRGVPLDEIAPLYDEARRRGMPMHMHLEEQMREIEECRAAYGATPMQLLLERLPSCESLTAVHATHSEPADLTRFLARGGTVCITPLTEANLGDGIPDITPLLAKSGRLSLGTDSNARISMIEEMRWLEYGQRLSSQTRGVFRNVPLLDFGTRGGASALGIDAGRIESGALADFVAIDLDSPAIAGAPAAGLLDAMVFGAGDEIVIATCVAGEWQER